MNRLRTMVPFLALAVLAAAPGALRAQIRSPHDSGFVLNHRTDAAGPTCAMCHAREFCSSCHVNAGAVEPIRTMRSDAQIAAQYAGRRWTYPRPQSHAAAGFSSEHGAPARERPAACATCHSRESCIGCHRSEERLLPVAVLPRASRGGARGVDLSGLRPRSHTAGFAREHRAEAAGGERACSSCHTQSYCASCHDGSATPGFHPTDYVQRHAEDAATRETDCASCHQTQAFCVSCHRATGQARTGAETGGSYHDAQPMWVFGHGPAARRAIETCASCHRQGDCLKCHSASAGWRVRPHGRGFDDDARAANGAVCRRCHVAGIPEGN